MSKYYAVKNGVKPGIYNSWPECKSQVDGYKGAIYKSFKTHTEAEDFVNNGTIKNIQKINNIQNKNIKLYDIDLLIYTDGSYKDNVGGYGVVIIENNNIKEYYGHIVAPCTNQVAELTAIKVALSNIGNNTKVHIRSDSMYSIDCFTKYIKTWKKNGFITTEKKPVKNQQLIKDIDALMEGKQITFEHVYSHRGEYYNEMVDQLAEKGRLNTL
jgi:ribonuclease HI